MVAIVCIISERDISIHMHRVNHPNKSKLAHISHYVLHCNMQSFKTAIVK